MIYRTLLRPLLFLLDAERAHRSGMGVLKRVGGSSALYRRCRDRFSLEDERLRTQAFGLDLPNPLGIAAGLDKNAEAYQGLAALGPGFVELGTVTPRPQKGNPRPRLFRLTKDRALLNRMGFNNDGVEAIAERLRAREGGPMLGANLGKNRDTPNEKAARDHAIGVEFLHPLVDYLDLNVSSPNTPGLRELQEKEALRQVLDRTMETRAGYSDPKPVLLKISPDLEGPALDGLLGIVEEKGVDGLIATNTSIDRKGLRTSQKKLEQYGQGGISGTPVFERANATIRYLKEGTGGRVPVIGVGGIMNEEDALARLDAGADLIQIYTGLIYEGPSLPKRILSAILERQEQEKGKHP